jgi:signal transduction histidine kinase
MTGLIFAIVLFATAMAALVALLYLRGRRRGREHAALLAAALGTISGICYRCEAGRARRLDGDARDRNWPLDLDMLCGRFATAEANRLTESLTRLGESGQDFFLRLEEAVEPPRLIEISGHRTVAAQGGGTLDLVWATDVTTRERSARDHAAQARDLELLRDAIERLPAPIWWRDETLAIRGANQRASELTGLTEATAPLAATATASKSPARAEKSLAAARGERPFELVEVPLESGGTIGFARDRSELVSMRAEMARLSAGHRDVLETLSTAIAIWGPDARLLFHNTAFARLWGLDHAWLATEPGLPEVLDRLREMRALPEHADFRRFKTEQLALFVELRESRDELMHLPDERTLRLRINRHPFGGLTFSYEDVTDRLALERSLNTLADVQRETLDNLFEGIAVFGSDGRLKLWNPAYGAIWQLDASELATRPHIAGLVDKTRPLYDTGRDWENVRAAAIERVTSYTPYTDRLERRDGSVLEVSVVPLPDGNVLMSYLDVTDSMRVQRALREKNEALETAGHLKTEFIANVSYELRTPLNAIIGFAEILTNQYFGALNDRQIEYSRGILDSSQRLLSLINDILDLAQIEAGQLALEQAPVDVHTLLAGILALSRERARRLEITLDFVCPTDIGTVLLDERRIRQALFNLVSNAIKFTPAGGAITLAAKRVDNEIALIVADTGIGIAPEHQARVFEKFERGDARSRQVGAGLGLSLVKSFVELHHGRIELESALSQGTRVTCWLPAEPPAVVPTVTPAGRPSRSSTRNGAPRRGTRSGEPREQPAPLQQTPTEST